MKSKILIIFCTLSAFLVKAQLPVEQKAQQEPVHFAKGKTLLSTEWDQFGVYAKYTPEHHVLGCWSTALAQILYYHRLLPKGVASYTSSKGYVVQDTLSKHTFDWNDFSGKITDTSSSKAIEAVARYSYFTAAAIRKDFGTGKYLQAVNPAKQIEEHFDCTAIFYASFTGKVPIPKEQLEQIGKRENIQHIIGKDSIMLIITKEINAKRPVYLHYGNFTTYGHSTVIDGYLKKRGVFWVHINYGSGGFRSGWYDLFKPIDG